MHADPRWIGTGRVLEGNKGHPVRQYEPFFTGTDAYEDEADVVEQGVSSELTDDPLGRAIRTDHPDGTVEEVRFDPWWQERWDRCDTITGSDWETARTGSTDPLVQRSLAASQAHAGTPSTAHLDTLGRTFETQESPDGGTTTHTTTVAFDVQGNPRSVTDARSIITQADVHDAMGRAAYTESPDAGLTWVLLDVAGQPIRTWKSGDLTIRRTYDALRRPVGTYVTDGVLATERLAELSVYGDLLAASSDSVDTTRSDTGNFRGRPWRIYDEAGLVEVGSYDFKGNPLSRTRTFLSDVDTEVDWATLASQASQATLDSTGSSQLISESFTTSTTYDALNRVVTQTTPDGSVTRPTYDDGGLLQAVEVELRGAATATPFVRSLEHNARGQRTQIVYSENAADDDGAFTTTYDYDPLTYRLTRLRTVRDSDSVVMQDWTYTYDAVGNIVQISDAAQDTIYFNNAAVDATSLYVYDDLYRLVSAQGRQRVGLARPEALEANDATDIGGIPDANATESYLQTYVYDAVGNIVEMTHAGGTEASPGTVAWHRYYEYADDSNRLLSTSQVGESQAASPYGDPSSATRAYGDVYVHSVRGAMDVDSSNSERQAVKWSATREPTPGVLSTRISSANELARVRPEWASPCRYSAETSTASKPTPASTTSTRSSPSSISARMWIGPGCSG